VSLQLNISCLVGFDSPVFIATEMPSPQLTPRLTIRIPGRSMAAATSSNKENAPVTSLGGGDAIGGRQGIRSPKVIHDVFGTSYPCRTSAATLIMFM
jgi:hypothetical protein